MSWRGVIDSPAHDVIFKVDGFPLRFDRGGDHSRVDLPLDTMNEMRLVATGSASQFVDSRYYLAPVGGVGWLAGVWLAGSLDIGLYTWLALAIPLIGGAYALWGRGRIGLVLAFCIALALGGVRYAVAQPPYDASQIHFYNGARDIVLRGVVTAEPSQSDTRRQLRLEVRELIIDGSSRPVAGTVQVETGRFPTIPYGATLEVSGDLSAPLALGNPGYAAYLERHGVRSVMEFPRVDVVETGGGSPISRFLIGLKDKSRTVIATALPEPQAALLTGILLGDDSGMPRTLSDDFRETGMTHIIAISGFNIAVIIALLDSMTAPFFPRRLAAVMIMVLVGLYTILVGAGASVVRAALMGVSYLVGLRLLGRSTLAIAGLFTAAFLMTLARPDALWDVGFQLSFAATLGLMLYAGPWTRRLDRQAAAILEPQVRSRVVKLMSEVLIVTLAAQVLTLPLLLFHFGRLSLTSLPANILILPVQPAVMATGGLALLSGLVMPAAGQVAGWIAWLFLTYTISVISLLAQIPAASVPLPLSAQGLVFVYLIIAGITILPVMRIDRRPTVRARPRLMKGLLVSGAMLGLAGFSLLIWNSNRPDGRLHVAFLDVGQGDSIFIQTPGGRQVLFDGGRYPSVTLDELGRQMPFWDRSIDLVIATHPDVDHVAGLVEVVARYNVAGIVTNGAAGESDDAYSAMLAEAGDRGSVIHTAQKGEFIKLEEGVQLEILHSGSPGETDRRNDASVVARLTYGNLSVLLTGDAEEAAETEMIRDGRALEAVVLKAGHHGANTSSSEQFLKAVSPQIVIISAGQDNSYGHPHPAMLARAEAVGATLLRTDEMGTLELESDGRQMWWTVEKSSGMSLP